MNPHLPELRNQIAQHVEIQKKSRAQRVASASRLSSGASRISSDENTIQGPVPDASCFSSTCSSLKRAVVSCSKCICHPGESCAAWREEDRGIHEIPGVTLAGDTRNAQVLDNAGVEIREDTLTAHQQNLGSLIDYAAKNLNVAVSVDSAKLLDNAVDVIGAKIRETENVKHAPEEVFFSGAAFKQGSRIKSHWKLRYFRLTYGGQLKWFEREESLIPKGFFQITSSSIVEPITRDGGFYLTRIQSGGGASFAFACQSVEQCNVWAAKFRSLIEGMKKKRAQSINSRTRSINMMKPSGSKNQFGAANARNASNTSIISALS